MPHPQVSFQTLTVCAANWFSPHRTHCLEGRRAKTGQPLVKQKLCSQDRRVPALPLLSARSIPPPHPGQILWLACHLFDCCLSKQEQFLLPHFPSDSVLLVSQTTTNSREILVGKGKNLKEHRVRGKGEENRWREVIYENNMAVQV